MMVCNKLPILKAFYNNSNIIPFDKIKYIFIVNDNEYEVSVISLGYITFKCPKQLAAYKLYLGIPKDES